jgi:hypothetical protein
LIATGLSAVLNITLNCYRIIQDRGMRRAARSSINEYVVEFTLSGSCCLVSWPSTPSLKAPRPSPSAPQASKRTSRPTTPLNGPFQGHQTKNETKFRLPILP